MGERLGDRLLVNNKITEEQLREALEHQRLNGGRLGKNLVALGLISEEELPGFFKQAPKVPRTLEETGLGAPFIADLILKHAVQMEEFRIQEMAERVRLPVSLVDKSMDDLRRDRFIEVKGAGQISRLSYILAVTDAGRNRAADLYSVCRYMGPAPVPFEEYRRQVEIQTVKSIMVSEESVKAAFAHLSVKESLLNRLGPAVSSGRAIFLYGPPGNGKTTIAETIGGILPGTIFVPHAILVGGEIVTIYDTGCHQIAEADPEAEETDQRWLLVKRPVVMVGGELTLKSLDLDFNRISKFYEAPLQLKANNGLFLVDDFGRQQVDPQHLLNRWIVPLERRTDFLTLHTGMKFEVPFDQLVVFSTNLEPKNLVDEAFLRRIRYKIQIAHPDLGEYEFIFRKVCESNGIAFDGSVFEFLVDNYYRKLNVSFNACHPRDLLDQIIDIAHYRGKSPEFTKEAVAEAWANYFVEL
jgi:energy-coupling factor transporter ATP-binding protein EcfA2